MPAQSAPTYPIRSQTQRTITLKLLNSDEVLKFPCKVSTTVQEVKEAIAERTLVHEDKLDFCAKQGAYYMKLLNESQVQPVCIVKGIKSFSPEKVKWPHPIGIIGTGYNGLKAAMGYLQDKNENIVLFDRNKHVGGYCWITGANKTSRLQTELGSFHIWWGPCCMNAGVLDYPNCNVDQNAGTYSDVWKEHVSGKKEADLRDNTWQIWPYKDEIQRHFKLAADMWGVNAFCKFETNVFAMKVIGDKNAESRYYNLNVKNLKDEKTFEVPVSCMMTFPGSLTRNRIIEYPGEDVFGGSIGYGMNDDCPYEELKDSTIAILGNGAFAVENARTCLECGGTKAYLVTRRKNLASPRMPSWFVHQGPLPVPGWMVLNCFKPMYDLAGWEDPYDFWSVHSNAARNHVTIIQNSRFGIGDVTFLMVAWGLLEYRVGTVKRMSEKTLHLSDGSKIEGVTIVLKALGLLGDYAVDKLHDMKEMVGYFCAGDWRRMLLLDDTGMNAANFTTFSTGIRGGDMIITWKFLYEYPQEFYKIESMGMMKMLPKHKAEPEADKPVYVTNVEYSMNANLILTGYLPKLGEKSSMFPGYKYTMYHKSHSVDRTLEVAKQEWDRYQDTWKSRGIKHDYVPYPYSKDTIQEWCNTFNKHYSEIHGSVYVPIDPDGKSAPGWGFTCKTDKFQLS